MGVQLFKKGDTHVFKGIKCTFEVFPVEFLEAQLKDGWTADINDLVEKRKPGRPKKVEDNADEQHKS